MDLKAILIDLYGKHPKEGINQPTFQQWYTTIGYQRLPPIEKESLPAAMQLLIMELLRLSKHGEVQHVMHTIVTLQSAMLTLLIGCNAESVENIRACAYHAAGLCIMKENEAKEAAL